VSTTAVQGRSFGRDAFAAAAFFTRLPSPYRDAPPTPPARLLAWGPAVGIALAVACALPAETVLRLVSGLFTIEGVVGVGIRRSPGVPGRCSW
jgi:cobalamin synthase